MSTRTIPISAIILVLCLQLPLAVRAADDAGLLKAETASVDTRPTQPASSAPTSTTSVPGANPSSPEPEKTLLYGSARKHEKNIDTGVDSKTGQASSENTSSADAKLQSENAGTDAYKLAVEKLTSGQELSADEYRDLGVGCLGYESDRPFFQNIAMVSTVYLGSPAYEAGIRAGDQMIDNEDDEQAKANPSQPLWSVSFDQAGTAEEVTVLRKGKPVKLTLVRMNIEDIQEDKILRMWEGVIRRLGYPQGGTFSGKSLHNLSRTK